MSTLDHPRHDGTVSLSLGWSGSDHVSHLIPDVVRIFIERTDEGADSALCIESANGTRTIVRFRVAAVPATVDGIVHR